MGDLRTGEETEVSAQARQHDELRSFLTLGAFTIAMILSTKPIRLGLIVCCLIIYLPTGRHLGSPVPVPESHGFYRRAGVENDRHAIRLSATALANRSLICSKGRNSLAHSGVRLIIDGEKTVILSSGLSVIEKVKCSATINPATL